MKEPEHVGRREFIAVTGLTLAASACGGREDSSGSGAVPSVPRSSARVAIARAGTPERNLRAALDAWGGIESLVGPEDLVLLKVNAQWYAQGMTNTDAVGELVRAILDRPGGFTGEVVIADNHHYAKELSRGWTTDRPNGRRNLQQLVDFFRSAGHDEVAAVQWRDAGANPEPWQGDAGGGTRVSAPGAGEGYRWWLEECYATEDGKRCAMTWPVFKTPKSGELVDLKDGIYRDGVATGRPVRMFNLSSLNHHSRYAGVTASIKNLMGVVDMTCGFQGPEPEGYYNTHYIGMRSSHAAWRWAKRRGGALRRLVHRMVPEENALDFEHTGGALGHWMRTVRMPDLHIVTAEWVGFGSRTVEKLSGRPGMLLASDDPVTLDAVAGRDVLVPLTRKAGASGRPFLSYNDPDREGPFRRFLSRTRQEIGGVLSPEGLDLVRTIEP